jgi:peptidyl-prolyl cis-trans isomerase B (cyclophilin B)
MTGEIIRRIMKSTCLVLAAAFVAVATCMAANLDGVPVRNTGHYASLDTDRGIIVIEFYPAVAPKTVENFETLTKKGFYNGLTFHRVVPGFVVQGGDPKGDGTGGPGYKVKAEFNKNQHVRGVVAMARSQDPDSAGSQFYITLAPAHFLDGKYTVFGKVTSGMNIVDNIKKGDKMKSVKIIEVAE